MKTQLWHVIFVSATVVACGGGVDSQEAQGGSGAAEPTTSIAPTTEPSEVVTDTSVLSDVASDEEGDTASRSGEDFHLAVVTIGERTFEFTTIGYTPETCDSFLGALQVVLYLPDENGVALVQGADPASGGLAMVLAGEGFEEEGVGKTSISVTLWDNDGQPVEEWIASEAEYERVGDLPDGVSQVDSYTIDDNTASGTATFYERSSYADEILVEQGTFEVTCVEE